MIKYLLLVFIFYQILSQSVFSIQSNGLQYDLTIQKINNEFHSERMGQKDVLQIYYVVDTKEPFMKLGVEADLESYKKACQESKSFNWVALINSEIPAILHIISIA